MTATLTLERDRDRVRAVMKLPRWLCVVPEGHGVCGQRTAEGPWISASGATPEEAVREVLVLAGRSLLFVATDSGPELAP